MRKLSFANRLLLVAFVPALMVGILMSLYLAVSSLRESERSELQSATTLAQGLSRAAEFGVATRNRILLAEASTPVLEVPSIYALRYFDEENRLIEQFEDLNHVHGDISVMARMARVFFSQQPLISQVRADILRTDLTLSQDPLFETLDNLASGTGGEYVGSIELEVDLSLSYEQQIATIRRAALIVFLILIVAMLAAYRLARSVIDPVRVLTSSVRSLADKDYVEVPDVGAGSELDELAQGIDYLSRELRRYHGQQTESIRLATVDLQNTLTLLEVRNSELEQARQSAETASAFKSQFVANVSHELRTPLNAIIGTLSVMNRSGLDITQIDQIDMIRASSDTLLYLIEDILDISRIESGNLVVESIDTNLEKLLADLANSAAMQAVEQGIELFIEPIPDPALRQIHTDPLRLKQVLSNLLSNAIKFTHAGHVHLSMKIIESTRRQRTLRFIVEDTGIGIPAEQLDSLFSAFTQADMSTTRRYGGTGLGLYICKGIVDLLDGSITMSSTVNEGTRIEVELPFRLSSAAVQPPEQAVPGPACLDYHDNYAPLRAPNQTLLGSVLSRMMQDHEELPDRIVVKNIPNRCLKNTWAGPEELERVEASHTNGGRTLHLAWISQNSALIATRLQQAGYDGFVIKTPSRLQLRRRLQIALNGHCFLRRVSSTTSDERPKRTMPSLTVLAVDDQRLNIDLLMQYFDHLELRGIYAASGKEALTYIETEQIDIALLDLHMPEQDGFDVAARIRSSNTGNAQIPLIAMTADAYSTTRDKAMESGFDDVLIKPATVQQVSDTLWRWVRNRQQASTATTVRLIDVRRCAAAVRSSESWARNALRTYGEEIPEHIKRLQSALDVQDSEALYETGHALKGVSQLFHLDVIAKAAEDLEQHCSQDDWNHIALSVRELEQLLQQARVECLSLE